MKYILLCYLFVECRLTVVGSINGLTFLCLLSSGQQKTIPDYVILFRMCSCALTTIHSELHVATYCHCQFQCRL
jgi:hypothetical protein